MSYLDNLYTPYLNEDGNNDLLNETSVEKYLELERRFADKQRRLTSIADQRRNNAWQKEEEIAKRQYGLTPNQYYDLSPKDPRVKSCINQSNHWANTTLRGRARIDKPGVIGHGAIVRLINWMDKKGFYKNGLKKI